MSGVFSVNGMKRPKLLILLIILIEGLGYLSSVIGGITGEIYNTFIKPSFFPPKWIFVFVWIILYFLMALSLYRILLIGEQGENTGRGITLFLTQLILNFLWSLIFFKFKLTGLAFIELLVLIIFIALTSLEFFQIDKTAGCIMVPYLLWAIFAAVLNFSIWCLNL